MSLSIKLSENGGAAPEAVPYMPAGESEICATVNGAPGRRVVVADEAAAERLNADLQEKLQAAAERKKARPLLMFDHNVNGGAAAVPVGFEWDAERGILLRVEWTQAGREAVEGGTYGYVSPSFRLKAGGSEILGLADGVEIGSLVNDPAFERNECIAASKCEVDGDEVRAAQLVSLVDTLPPQGKEQEREKMEDNEGTPGGVGLEVNQNKKKDMEEIAKLLGLPADADAATICAKIAALKNQGAADKKRIEEVEAEKEEHKKALTEHKHAAADAFVERQKKEGKIAPMDKERLQAAKAMYLNDPAGAECIFAGMKRVDNVREDGAEAKADKVSAAANRNYENLSLAELLAEENA